MWEFLAYWFPTQRLDTISEAALAIMCLVFLVTKKGRLPNFVNSCEVADEQNEKILSAIEARGVNADEKLAMVRTLLTGDTTDDTTA